MCLLFSAASEDRIQNLGLGGKIGIFWEDFGTFGPFGTKSRIWDLFGAPECGQIPRFTDIFRQDDFAVTTKGSL